MVATLWAFFNQLFEDAREAMEPLGLHHKTLAVLALLDFADSPQALADAMQTPAPSLSYLLKSLEDQGFIAREINPQDKRRFILKRTERGDQAMQAGIAQVNALMDSRMADLKAEERAALESVMPVLQKLTPRSWRPE